MDLENAFLGKCFSQLSGTQVGMMKFVLGYFVLVFFVSRLGCEWIALDLSARLSMLPPPSRNRLR